MSDIIKRLRQAEFVTKTEQQLLSHPYIKAAEEGTLTLPQKQAFAREQYHIQISDAISFSALAGHQGFVPKTLTGAVVPEKKENGDGLDLFQFLLGGEVYASSLLLAFAKSVGLNEEELKSSETSAKAQAYPSYWSRLALSNKRAAGAAACAVNFPAWTRMCARLLNALGESKEYQNVEDEQLGFIKFFATPIDNLDEMAAAVIEEEYVTYEDLVRDVRLLNEYEVMFWDAVFEAK